MDRSREIKSSSERRESLNIVRRLSEEGFKALFAGGAVRDMVIGREPSDFDIVTNASAEEILSIFAAKKVRKVGKSFEVCMVNGVEVAPCRSDASEAEEEPVSFPDSDLAHRDITINSMAFDPVAGSLIDPFGGREDLAGKVIRFTGSPEDRIEEDPLRMVRACRFASLIQGTFAPSTLMAIREQRHLLVTRCAPERIRHEILKAMEQAKPSLFFRALQSTALLELIFPSLSRCADLDGGKHHGETVFEHCLLSGDALSSRKTLLRLAGYLHDTGKYDAAQIKDGDLTFPDHEKMGEAALSDLQNLRFSSDEIKFIDAVIKTHMRPLKEDSTPRAVRRLLAFLRSHDIGWQTFMQMRIADKSANLAKPHYNREDIRVRVGKIHQELRGGGLKGSSLPLSAQDIAISGHDIMALLNISPGPDVGKIVNHLFECVLDEPSINNSERLKEIAISYWSASH